jgi:hypothetical protein
MWGFFVYNIEVDYKLIWYLYITRTTKAMNKILVTKIKQALKSNHSVELIKEIVSEYDEMIRLAKWRRDIIVAGKELEKYKKQLVDAKKELEKYGYYDEFCDCDLDREVREYFNKI